MGLSKSHPIGVADVEEICQLRDDVYRNRWITFAYWDISQQLRKLVGDNASWCTFSTWSSRTIGENLRLDKATRRIEELIYDEQTSISRRDHPWVLRLQYRMTTRDNGDAQLALAMGNRLIFHEIGYAVIQLLDWVQKSPRFDLGAWQTHRTREVKSYPANDLFPKADIEQLWRGLDCLYQASNARNDVDKAELVLRGNVLLAAYEQKRADQLLKIALDPRPGDLVRAVQADPHLRQLSLGNAKTPWLRRALAAAFGAAMTRWVMALDVPFFAWTIRPVRLGYGIPRPPVGTRYYPPALETLRPDLAALLEKYDQSGGKPERCAAQNWRCFDDRMNFIVNLFRTGQQDMNLYRPLPAADLRTLDIDLSDTRLDSLRMVGDDEIDQWIPTHLATKGNAKQYVRRLVANGFADLLAADPSTPRLPDWADKAKLWAGQEFFRRYGLEIAAALFSASLPMSYTAARGARVLTTTAALVSDPRRRLAETGQMLLDAMASDDSSKPPLDPDTRAYQAARGIRLFHGAVRHLILTDPGVNWHTKTQGIPINQEDLVGTLSVFTVAVIASLDEMGVTCTVEDRDAFFHLWLVIGHLLGINYDGLYRQPPLTAEPPLTYAEMQLLARVILERNADSSPGGRELMAALLDVSERSMPPFLKDLPRTVTRRLIGNKDADMLGVPRAGPTRLLTAVLRPVNAMISPHVRTNFLGGLTSALTRRSYRWWIQEGHGSRPPWRFDDTRPPWLDKTPIRARRRVTEVVNASPLVPRPAKELVSAIVGPD
jgi:ER-bound oxygenase mpaB/B'/Rubber oxygenase, catalytic domain